MAIFTNEYPPNVYGGAGVHVEYLSRALARKIAVEVRSFGEQRVNEGNLTVSRDMITGNAAAVGGGIATSTGSLTVTSSTISGNSAGNGGGIAAGGIGITGPVGPVTITGSTISGNSGYSGGGGLFDFGGPVTIAGDEAAGVDAVEGTLPRRPGDRLAASYVNFYLGNSRIVHPLLDPTRDEEAAAILAATFPEHEIVGVPAREILLGGGNIHCITQQVPAV